MAPDIVKFNEAIKVVGRLIKSHSLKENQSVDMKLTSNVRVGAVERVAELPVGTPMTLKIKRPSPSPSPT